jgi:hypothetical protein
MAAHSSFFRLEAATSRLEDIAAAQAAGSVTLQPTSSASLRASVVPPAASIAQPLGSSREHVPVASSLGAAPDAVPTSVSAFDERIIRTKLKEFLNLTQELGYGPLVDQVGRHVLRRITSIEKTLGKDGIQLVCCQSIDCPMCHCLQEAQRYRIGPITEAHDEGF